jgi:hypothetical protein
MTDEYLTTVLDEAERVPEHHEQVCEHSSPIHSITCSFLKLAQLDSTKMDIFPIQARSRDLTGLKRWVVIPSGTTIYSLTNDICTKTGVCIGHG